MLNNQTTLEICDESFRYEKLLYISKMIWQILGIFCITIGIPGHCCQIILSSNGNNRKDPASLYFSAIAVFELIFLLGSSKTFCEIIIIK